MKRLLFITSPGRATDILVKRALEASKTYDFPVQIDVGDDKEGFERLAKESFDMVLLSPLLRYVLNDDDKKELFEKTPYYLVDSMIYGSLNGEAIVANIILKIKRWH